MRRSFSFLVVHFFQLVVCSLFFVRFTLAQTSVDMRAIVSLKKMFGDSVSVASKNIRLTPADKDSLAHLTNFAWIGDSIHAYACQVNGAAVGYGFVDDVKGKTQYITYLTAVKPDGKIRDIDVLAYRESYGGEIAYESFRKQFREKSSADKLQPGKDIKNISGATISVHAITAGVKKILYAFNLLRPRLDRQ